MSRIRTYLLVTIGFAFAGMIGAAFGTSTAQAVVAILVEVVNPTTSPVPSLNVTDPGRIVLFRCLQMRAVGLQVGTSALGPFGFSVQE
jgi:hypothetical protein